MCRDKNQGGRRCPHDNAEARRNRRQNSKLIEEFQDKVDPRSEPKTLELKVEREITVEYAKELVTEYNDILSRTDVPADNKSHTNFAAPLTDEEILAERKLIELGNAVSVIAEKHGMPTQEEWDSYYADKERSDEISLLSYKHTKRITELEMSPDLDEYDDDNPENIELEKLYDEQEKLAQEQDSLPSKVALERTQASLTTQRSQAYLAALREVGVEFAETEDLPFHPESDKTSADKVRSIVSMYPKAWIANTGKIGTLRTEATPLRAGYMNGEAVIKLTEGNDKAVAMHELGHLLEDSNPELGFAERAFLNRRSGLLDYHQGKTNVEPKIQTKGNEYHFADNFSVSYVGRVYDKSTPDTTKKGSGGGFYEVLTTGVEETFFGKHTAEGMDSKLKASAKGKDPEHIDFVLGLFASTAK